MDIWDRALGFMDAQVLLTAEKLGVFDALDAGPCHTAEVARAVNLPEEAMLRLLTALHAQQLVRRAPDARWENGAEASEKLVRGKPGYIGGMFRHIRDDLYPVWQHLDSALREGRAQWHRAFPDGPAPTESVYGDPERLHAFMEGMHAITYPSGFQFARQEARLGELSRIVDVGGGAGSFLIALAEAHPRLRGTVYDLPAVAPVAASFLRRHGLEDRLDFRGGDFWEDPLPEGADAYCLGFILHDWEASAGSVLLEKVAKASRPGAWLVLGEYLLNEDRGGPLFVARQDLNMLVAARGRERTASEYADWIGAFGYRLDRIHLTNPGKCFLMARLEGK